MSAEGHHDHGPTLDSLRGLNERRGEIPVKLLEAFYASAPELFRKAIDDLLGGHPAAHENEDHRLLLTYLFLLHRADANDAVKIFEKRASANATTLDAIRAFYAGAVKHEVSGVMRADMTNPVNHHRIREHLVPEGRVTRIFTHVYENVLSAAPPSKRAHKEAPPKKNITALLYESPLASGASDHAEQQYADRKAFQQKELREGLIALNTAINRYAIADDLPKWWLRIAGWVQDPNTFTIHSLGVDLLTFDNDLDNLIEAIKAAREKETTATEGVKTARIIKRPLDGTDVLYLLMKREVELGGGGGPTRVPDKTAEAVAQFAVWETGKALVTDHHGHEGQAPARGAGTPTHTGGIRHDALDRAVFGIWGKAKSVAGEALKGARASLDIGRVSLAVTLAQFPFCKDIDLTKNDAELAKNATHAFEKLALPVLVSLMQLLRTLGVDARTKGWTQGLAERDIAKAGVIIEALEALIIRGVKKDIVTGDPTKAHERVPAVLAKQLFEPMSHFAHGVEEVEAHLTHEQPPPAPAGAHAHPPEKKKNEYFLPAIMAFAADAIGRAWAAAQGTKQAAAAEAKAHENDDHHPKH